MCVDLCFSYPKEHKGLKPRSNNKTLLAFDILIGLIACSPSLFPDLLVRVLVSMLSISFVIDINYYLYFNSISQLKVNSKYRNIFLILNLILANTLALLVVSYKRILGNCPTLLIKSFQSFQGRVKE